jgi:predicted RNA binding protein YcfA (HicA-like mRNA interferase family)
MPPKIRELIRELETAGFENRGGKDSHRKYRHPGGINVTISGKLGAMQNTTRCAKSAKQLR